MHFETNQYVCEKEIQAWLETMLPNWATICPLVQSQMKQFDSSQQHNDRNLVCLHRQSCQLHKPYTKQIKTITNNIYIIPFSLLTIWFQR